MAFLFLPVSKLYPKRNPFLAQKKIMMGNAKFMWLIPMTRQKIKAGIYFTKRLHQKYSPSSWSFFGPKYCAASKVWKRLHQM
jgi:hypothetical protein